MYSIDEIAGVSKKAFQEGYAQGLEVAANTVYAGVNHTWGRSYDSKELAQVLRNEAKRVREMGVNNENTQ